MLWVVIGITRISVFGELYPGKVAAVCTEATCDRIARSSSARTKREHPQQSIRIWSPRVEFSEWDDPRVVTDSATIIYFKNAM